MKLNKENLLSFYEMKKRIIQEFLDKADSREEIIGWNNQLNLIDSLIEDLKYFD